MGRRLRDVALVVAATAVALVAAEIGLRILVGPPAEFVFSRSFHDAQSDFDVTYGTLPDGRRRVCGPEGAPERRVAVLGDSFVFGQGVADCRDFTSLLAAELPDLRFENFGAIGAGLHDYRVVARDLLGDRFDAALLILYGNDVSEVRIDRSVVGRLTERLSLMAMVRRAYYRRLVATHLAEAERGESDRVRTFQGKLNNILSTIALNPAYYREAADPLPEQRDEFTRQFAELVAVLRAHVGADGVTVAVVPEGHVVSGALRAFLLDHGGEVAEPGKPGGAYELIRGLCADSGVRFVETFDAFRDGDALYYPHDLHWTEAGHRRMAEVLGAALVREP